MGIGPAVVGLDAEHRLADLHVVADLAADQSTGKPEPLDRRVVADIPPALVTPGHGAGRRADVRTGPVVRVDDGYRVVLDAAAPVGVELVAQAGVEVPAFDILADLVVDAGVAEPAGVDDRGCRTEGELPVGADAAGRGREHRTVEDDAGAVVAAGHGPRRHVAGELVEHAGREERLPGQAARREVRADAEAEATEHALDIVDRHRAGCRSGRRPSGKPGTLSGSTDTRDHTTPPDGSMNQPPPSA